jgi:hypothetical protein
LPAIVVKEEDGRLTYPGSGYYPVAHPGVDDEEELLVLWGRELEAVRRWSSWMGGSVANRAVRTAVSEGAWDREAQAAARDARRAAA